MTTRQIIPDPIRLFRLGLRNLMDLAILVYISRCGVEGAGLGELKKHLQTSYSTINTGCNRLEHLKLIVCIKRTHKSGSPRVYAATKRGWNLLTEHEGLTMIKP